MNFIISQEALQQVLSYLSTKPLPFIESSPLIQALQTARPEEVKKEEEKKEEIKAD